MQGASEGVRDRVRSHRNETSSVKESESAVGRNVQKGVGGKSLKSEPRESAMRERDEREEASWRAIFVGAQTRLLHWILFCAANNCKRICTVSRRTLGRGRFVI